MEDEKIISLTARNTKIMAEFLFKVLFLGAEKLYEIQKDMRLGSRVFHGETEWNKFMESLDPITVKNLKNNEINLDKFKEEIEKYGIGFSFYKHSDGESVSMAFSVKHKDIVENALAETLEKIVNKDKVWDKVKKDPKDKTLSEKLNYYKNKEETIISEKNNIKEPEIVEKMSKGEKSL